MRFWNGSTLFCILLAGSLLAQETVSPYATSEPLDPNFKSFDQTIIAFMQRHNVPGGALAVVREGKLVYVQGYGFADKDRQEPARATSLFRIASISKPITAVAILKLAQSTRYHLDLDTKAFPLLGIMPFLEKTTKPDPRLSRITIRQLLQHTAGFDRDRSGDPMFDPLHIAKVVGTSAPPTPNTIIRYMMGRPLDFTPGSRHVYSNFGYCVLGRIIEKVTGKPYEAYVREAILAPIQIRRMRIGKSLLADRAKGEVRYYQESLGHTTSVFPIGEKEAPWCYGGFYLEAMDSHGGWLASAVDLARFAAQLDVPNTPAPLDAKHMAEMGDLPPAPVARKSNGTPEPAYYGLGWNVRPVGKSGKANYWHTGSLPGSFTLLVRRSDGITWAVLFNQRSENEGEIDPALHRAANAVPLWEPKDLFNKYLSP